MDTHQRLLRQEPETHGYVVAPDSAAQVQAPDLRGQGIQGRETFAYGPAPGK